MMVPKVMLVALGFASAARDAFDTWARAHGLQYESAAEVQQRRAIWAANARLVHLSLIHI